MHPRRRSLTARVVAGVLLVAIALWLAPRLADAASDQMDCAVQHTLPAGSMLDATTAPGACDSGSMDWCSLMPGCSASPPAFVAVSGFVPTVSLPAAAPARATPSDHGLLALGPPTPPPIR